MSYLHDPALQARLRGLGFVAGDIPTVAALDAKLAEAYWRGYSDAIADAPSLTRLWYWIRPYDQSLDARRWRWRMPGCWRMSKRGRLWQRAVQRAAQRKANG